jgi:hypothetical protein
VRFTIIGIVKRRQIMLATAKTGDRQLQKNAMDTALSEHNKGVA